MNPLSLLGANGLNLQRQKLFSRGLADDKRAARVADSQPNMQDSLQLSHWADGVGLEERARQLAAALRASFSAEEPCAWLRRDRVLLSVNPGRPLPGLHCQSGRK